MAFSAKILQTIVESKQLLSESADTEWGLNRSDAGKMHEVLTGGLINHYASVYQANKKKGHDEAHKLASESISNPQRSKNKKINIANIAHMEQFRDESANKSASDWHEHLSAKLNQTDYDEHLAHATHAANSIINHMHEQGIKDIKKTHFTANAKDIEKLTNGKDSSQRGNNSDIVVEHGHSDKGGGFFGVSLKSGETSKLANPGMGTVHKLVDDFYAKITGKKSNFSAESDAADRDAQEDHHKIIAKHAANISKILGKNSLRSGADKRPQITKSALDMIRYAHEHSTGRKDRSKKLKGLSDAHISRLASAYGELQQSRLTRHKRPVAQSLQRHLSDMFSSKHDGKKGIHALRNQFIAALSNTPSRDAGSMSILRHNTIFKKGKRTSEMGYGLGDSAKNTNSFEIVGGKGIGLNIIGYGKNKKSKTLNLKVHTDSSPSEGSGSGKRKGVHVVLNKPGKEELNEEVSKAALAAQIFESRMSKEEKRAAAAERIQSAATAAIRNRQIQQARATAEAESKSADYARQSKAANIAAGAIRKQTAEPETQTYWRDESGMIRGVGGARFAAATAKNINLSDRSPDLFESQEVSEEAPANAMGTAGISGLDTAVNVGIAGRDMLLAPGPLRRPPPKMFGGKRVFTVPSSDYYKATLGKKKGQHWRSMVNGPLGEEIRQYALDNKDAPIIVEDETTGAMMYLRYGKR